MNSSLAVAEADANARTSRWSGLPVHHWDGSYDEIIERIPAFDRRPFAFETQPSGLSENQFYDLIVRRAVESDKVEVPVGVVSKSYSLIQHRDIATEARKAAEGLGIDCNSLKCSLSLTDYGERMALFLQLPGDYEFDPGDGHPMTLRLCCFNSVDGNSGLVAHVGWYRFVCSNGLVVGVTSSRFRAIHNRHLDIGAVGAALRHGVELGAGEKRVITRWIKVPISEAQLVRWADGPLTQRWGVKAATRAFHIAQRGQDIEFADPFEKAPASSRSVKFTGAVPGALAPARNAYAVCQALSWLAKERNDVQERVQRTREIPSLMSRLLQ